MSRKVRSKHKRLVSLTTAPGGVKIPDRKKSRWRTFALSNRILNSLDKEGMEDRTDGTDRIVCQMDPSGLTSLTDSGLTNPIGPIGPIGPTGLTRPACPVNHPLPVNPCLPPPACQMSLNAIARNLCAVRPIAIGHRTAEGESFCLSNLSPWSYQLPAVGHFVAEPPGLIA